MPALVALSSDYSSTHALQDLAGSHRVVSRRKANVTGAMVTMLYGIPDQVPGGGKRKDRIRELVSFQEAYKQVS